MTGRTVLANLDGRGPWQRLQVSVSQGDDGHLLIDLREQHYAEGIGWFDQRRLELDPRQLQELQGVLGLKTELPRFTTEQSSVIPFPGLAPAVARRAAVGDRG
jgi:hypothetical protein